MGKGTRIVWASQAAWWLLAQEMYNASSDVEEAHNLIDDSAYAAGKARLQARMAYWTKESAHARMSRTRTR